MSDDLTPERIAYLRDKYINPPSTPQTAAAVALAEQQARAILDTQHACEVYNAEQGLAFINWELPTELREYVYRVRNKLYEATARDSREAPPGPRPTNDVPGIIWYYDDRNKYDEAAGWPPFDPDNPSHQCVPFGTICADPDTVHVLRGGTEERVQPSSRSWFQKPSEEARQLGLGDGPDSLPNYGLGYDLQSSCARPTGCTSSDGAT
jgi:hypothetical protein